MKVLTTKDILNLFYVPGQVFAARVDFKKSHIALFLGVLLLGLSKATESLRVLLINSVTEKSFPLLSTVDLTTLSGKLTFLLIKGVIGASNSYIFGGIIFWILLRLAGISPGKLMDVARLCVIASIPLSLFSFTDSFLSLMFPTLQANELLVLLCGLLILYGYYIYFKSIKVTYNASGFRFYIFVVALPVVFGILVYRLLDTLGVAI